VTIIWGDAVRPWQLVIDTNVVVAASRSRLGRSFRLVSLIGDPRFQINLSVPLVLEYEEVLNRDVVIGAITPDDIRGFLDYVCSVANQRTVFFRWRPFLADPKDDFILELAIEAGCDFIVTYNRRDFAGAESFGIRVVTPGEFLRIIGDTV